MKKPLLLLSLLIFSSNVLSQEPEFSIRPITDDTKFNCEMKWIIYDGQRYLPPESLKHQSIVFTNKMDNLIYSTKNGNSIYNYHSFLKMKNDSYGVSKGTLGMTFILKHSGNQVNYMDIFSDGSMMIFANSEKVKSISKMQCRDLRLLIKEL